MASAGAASIAGALPPRLNWRSQELSDDRSKLKSFRKIFPFFPLFFTKRIVKKGFFE